MSNKTHWNALYGTKKPSEMSWTQSTSNLSLKLVEDAKLQKTASIIDIGGGISVFSEELLALDFSDITVLDISLNALEATKNRLGKLFTKVKWLESDVLTAFLPLAHYDLWHDRAVFHFLMAPNERKEYVKQLTHSVKPWGFVIIATFSLDGPQKCSGLEVMRYDAISLQNEIGSGFQLKQSMKEAHSTPWSAVQHFIYCLFQKQS